MRCGLTCALWIDQQSIRGTGGQSRPSSPSRWQFVAGRHTAGARWGAGEPKWNANTGHISQGSLIGTQLLQGPSIPWSTAEAEEPVGHSDQVRCSLCVQLKILGLKWLVETLGRETPSTLWNKETCSKCCLIWYLNHLSSLKRQIGLDDKCFYLLPVKWMHFFFFLAESSYLYVQYKAIRVAFWHGQVLL